MQSLATAGLGEVSFASGTAGRKLVAQNYGQKTQPAKKGKGRKSA
jgi:hypothetical protein